MLPSSGTIWLGTRRLLNSNPDQAYRAAREVYEQEPKNPDYAATYAFSLYLQGDVKKALQALAGFFRSGVGTTANCRVLRRASGEHW
jgi:cytochrome c-type biogenesis protein CcmH/NrfG